MTDGPRIALAAALLAAPTLGLQDDTSPAPVVRPPQVTGVRAIHSSGQTFLTWTESAALEGESYRIYRSLAKFADVRERGVVDLGQRTSEDSGELYSDRVWEDRPCGFGATDCGRPTKPLPCFRPRYAKRHWIPAAAGGAREVPPGEGLLVWTPGAGELPPGADEGWAWYAVTTVDAAGVENTSVGPQNLAKVYERLDDPLPVEVPRAFLDCSDPAYCPYDNLGNPNPVPPGVHVFLQYMDLHQWNATFHAPNFTNCWWGEDPTAPRVQRARQYAYAYTVHEPDPSLGPPSGALLPVVVDLHQHAQGSLDQGWGPGGAAAYADGGRALKIVPIDVGDTWWYGFARDHDYRRPYLTCPPALAPCASVADDFPPVAPYDFVPRSGPVVNFTEFRVLRMVHDLFRAPLPGLIPDPARVYVQGTSMGGAGALQLATRYPGVFAAAASGKPMTDYEDYLVGVPPKPERDVRYELPHRFGAWPALAATSGLPLLTVETIGPGGMADHLAPWDGTVVWDWMDQVEQLADPLRRALGVAPFGVVSGFADETLPYPTQGEPFFTTLRDLGLSFGGKISCGGHGGSPFGGMPPALSAATHNPSPGPFSDYRVRLDETVPGFANLTLGAWPTPPTLCCSTCAVPGPFTYHHDLVWSSSWYAFDQPPVDERRRWEVSLKWTGSFAPPPRVDVVPLRTSAFEVAPGGVYQWANVELGSGRITQALGGVLYGSAIPQELVIEGVTLTPPGNRIVLWRVD